MELVTDHRRAKFRNIYTQFMAKLDQKCFKGGCQVAQKELPTNKVAKSCQMWGKPQQKLCVG